MTASLVYLHGFASGPEGTKALHCRAWAENRGLEFRAPDLNLPSFEALTLTAQVEAVEALLRGLAEPPVVVGSSLGGLVGAAVAHRGTPMGHLVLLAPAFGFARRRLESERWVAYRHHRKLPVFHHAYGRWVRMGSQLLDDLPAWRNDEEWSIPCPVTILHGSRDEAVPLAESEAFQRRWPDTVLHVLDDDHSLLAPSSLALLDQVLAGGFTRG